MFLIDNNVNTNLTLFKIGTKKLLRYHTQEEAAQLMICPLSVIQIKIKIQNIPIVTVTINTIIRFFTFSEYFLKYFSLRIP
jgi:hypothetical protein